MLVKVPSFSAWPAAGIRKTSVAISFRVEFTATKFGGVVPEGSGLGFHHLAHDQPFELRQGRALQTYHSGSSTTGFWPITKRPSMLPSCICSQYASSGDHR